jgi:uracil-DNA glycosylase family 4
MANQVQPTNLNKSLSPYQLHVLEWKDCLRCYYHETRNKVCIARGRLPCDVLFIGEAPGESEDSLGIPFCGPSGYLLNDIIKEAITNSIKRSHITYALTNLIGCIPIELDEDEHRGKLQVPSIESIMACTPRLQEIVKIANPKLIVCVGSLASQYTNSASKGAIKLPYRTEKVTVSAISPITDEMEEVEETISYPIPKIDITHPAALLRFNIAHRGLAIQRQIVILADGINNYILDEGEIPGPKLDKANNDTLTTQASIGEPGFFTTDPIDPVFNEDDIPF